MIDEKLLIEDLDKLEKGKFYMPALFYDLIQEQPQADKWIPCEEALPSEEIEVWVTHENGKVLRHYWFNGEFVQNYPLDEPRPYPKAIAWMPCFKPQPYKKEGAE